MKALQNKLTKIAREKGFGIDINVLLPKSYRYYIWLCLLKKWLEEEHGIEVNCNRNKNIEFVRYNYVIRDDTDYEINISSDYHDIDTCLTEGLYQALCYLT